MLQNTITFNLTVSQRGAIKMLTVQNMCSIFTLIVEDHEGINPLKQVISKLATDNNKKYLLNGNTTKTKDL